MGKPALERQLADNEVKAVGRMIRTSQYKLNLVAGMIRGKKVDQAINDLTFSNKRISAQKGRLIADLIRGKKVDQAINLLAFSPKKGAQLMKKLLESAIANAEHNDGADIDTLKVKTVHVERGTYMKRFMARAKGRCTRVQKHSCHIYLTVGD